MPSTSHMQLLVGASCLAAIAAAFLALLCIVCPQTEVISTGQMLQARIKRTDTSATTCEDLRREGPDVTPLDLAISSWCSVMMPFDSAVECTVRWFMMFCGALSAYAFLMPMLTFVMVYTVAITMYCVEDLFTASSYEAVVGLPHRWRKVTVEMARGLYEDLLSDSDGAMARQILCLCVAYLLVCVAYLLRGPILLVITIPYKMLLTSLPHHVVFMGIELWSTTYHMSRSILACQQIPGIGVVAFTTYHSPIYGALSSYRFVSSFSAELEKPHDVYKICGISTHLTCVQVWMLFQASDAINDIITGQHLTDMVAMWIQVIWWVSTCFSIVIPLAYMLGLRPSFKRALFDKFILVDIWQMFVVFYLLFNGHCVVVHDCLLFSALTSIASLIEAYNKFKTVEALGRNANHSEVVSEMPLMTI